METFEKYVQFWRNFRCTVCVRCLCCLEVWRTFRIISETTWRFLMNFWRMFDDWAASQSSQSKSCYFTEMILNGSSNFHTKVCVNLWNNKVKCPLFWKKNEKFAFGNTKFDVCFVVFLNMVGVIFLINH